jgi:hypothetical protein
MFLALVSAIGWSLLGVAFVIAYMALRDGVFAPGMAVEAVPFFAFFGFVAGLIYAVALGMSARWSRGRISGAQGALLGGLGGAVLYLGSYLTIFHRDSGQAGLLFTNFCVVGVATGFLMHRVAQRGALPPSEKVTESLNP